MLSLRIGSSSSQVIRISKSLVVRGEQTYRQTNWVHPPGRIRLFVSGDRAAAAFYCLIQTLDFHRKQEPRCSVQQVAGRIAHLLRAGFPL